MSNVSVCCPFCEAQMTAPEKLIGKSVTCPKCKNGFTVTAGEQRTAPVIPEDNGRTAWSCPRCKKTVMIQPGYEPLLCEDCEAKPPQRSKYAESVAAKGTKEVDDKLPLFAYTDIAAAITQLLTVVSCGLCLMEAVNAIQSPEKKTAAIFWGAGALSSVWGFAVAGAVRAIVSIARKP